MRVFTELPGNQVEADSYGDILPIETPIRADRQRAKRHYGVHPYFTRRPYNVVRQYILHFSQEGDTIVDPFGGSGVTAIEAFLENRCGIQNDINPLANFIASGIVNLSCGNINDYKRGLDTLREKCKTQLEAFESLTEEQLLRIGNSVSLPPNIALPASSDVEKYHDLFTLRQLLSLAILKRAIEELEPAHVHDGLLLAWSATLAKLNKTFLSAQGRAESRGGSSIFSIYRYKVAKAPIELPPWRTFEERALNVIAAKIELDKQVQMKRQTGGWRGRFQVQACDIQELAERLHNQADYIFTDPPYGAHISYLDLSTLWNSWLQRNPSEEVRRKELIVGGQLQLSDSQYKLGLRKSIESCVSMLKEHRWLSVVFQHWNPTYFEAILEAAELAGAELRAAVSQVGDPIWSMHKKKGNESVLAGEMILTFFKAGRNLPRKTAKSFDVQEAIEETLDATRSGIIYGEYLFNRIVVAAWRNHAIESLNISRTEFVDLIQRRGWQYNEKSHAWMREKHSTDLFPS